MPDYRHTALECPNVSFDVVNFHVVHLLVDAVSRCTQYRDRERMRHVNKVMIRSARSSVIGLVHVYSSHSDMTIVPHYVFSSSFGVHCLHECQTK